jgi:hypothetical protein
MSDWAQWTHNHDEMLELRLRNNGAALFKVRQYLGQQHRIDITQEFAIGLKGYGVTFIRLVK